MNLTHKILWSQSAGMSFGPTTMSRVELKEALSAAIRHPHSNVHKGNVIISPKAFQADEYETNVLVSRFALIDCTGFVYIGPWCNITARCRIYTHDHIHAGRQPLLALEKKYGVVWQDKYIGCLLYTSPSPRDRSLSRMPSSA